MISQDCSNDRVTQLITHFSSFINIVHLRHIRPHGGIPSYFIDNEYATSANVFFLLTYAFDYMEVCALNDESKI